MKCHARFQEQRLNDASQKADYTFELFWRQPEDRALSRDLFALIGEKFEIKSFELITDNGR
jgi:hypothetical protein